MPDEEELRELAGIFEAEGDRPGDRSADRGGRDEGSEVALETHAREELGIDMKEGLGSPWAAAASSFVTFSIGAVVPLLPFLFTSGKTAIVVSAALSAVTLFAVGVR